MFDIHIQKIEKSDNENNGTFLQTPFWCNFKARHGWSYNRFIADVTLPEDFKNPQSNKIQKKYELAVLNRNFCKNLLSIAYVPLMPQLLYQESAEEQTIEFANFLNELSLELKKYLPSNTIAIRFDPDVVFDSIEERDDFNLGIKTVALADRLKLKKNAVDIQPPDSTQIDLTLSEDEILSKMHQKWRYNIRLSEKKGVVIKRYTGNSVNLSEKLDRFYALTKETNARDGNSSHAKGYYFDLISSSAKENNLDNDIIPKTTEKPLISLFIAEHEGEEIASIMTLFSRDEAIYLYGASSNNKRNLMPNHLLQWTAIKAAKEYGSKIYDFYGMPPEGKDENHPMHGLYMFKANFGGRIIHRPGSWDVPLKFIYRPYKTAERLRAFWFKKVVKKLKGR
jgi:lipid II:glycine glycyltransferase (peptidoglycan interpeptide bridge formation enzyme)